MYKVCLLIVVIAARLPTAAVVAENSLKLDQIVQNGVTMGGGKLVAGLPVELRFRWTVGDFAVKGATNGFALYTYRNGEYTGGGTNSAGAYLDDRIRGWWDGIATLGIYSCDGEARDTLKFGGFAISGIGIPEGFSNQLTAIYSGNLTAGDPLGIDSSFAPPGAVWLWSTDGGVVYSDWPGAYCYPVVAF